MKAIVVGFDGTDQGERALARAAELAQALTAKLVVVSVGSGLPLAVPAPGLEPDPALVPTGIGQIPYGAMPVPSAPPPEAPAEEMLLLERARSLLAPRRVEAEYVGEIGDPAERVLGVADDRDADLIVVGSGGHGLLERLFGHSVDAKLARRTQRDILLVH